MPALPDVPSVLRFDMHFTIGEDLHAKDRFFMSYTGTAPTNAQLTTLAGAVATAYDTDLKNQAAADRTLTEIVITDLTSATASVGSDAVAIVGTLAGPGLPGNISTLESLGVTRRYRGGHPRIYWPFGGESVQLDDQKWTVAFVNGLDTQLALFYTAVKAAVWAGGGVLSQVNVSYYEGFTVHTGVTGRARNVSTVRLVPLIDPVVGHQVRQGLASQRKRLLRLA
jgi:hypothetical protein